jgi:hypothetical protein
MLTPAGSASPAIFGAGQQLGVGFIADGTYCGTSTLTAGVTCGLGGNTAGTSIQLTTVWGVDAAYEHFWTPSLRTSLVGAYNHISYNNAASLDMCGAFESLGGGAGQASGTLLSNTAATTFGASCGRGSFDWSYYSISTRTQWNITKDFYVGLEGYYGHLNTMSKGQTINYQAAANTAQPTGVRTLDDQNVFVYRMRVHRDLVP